MPNQIIFRSSTTYIEFLCICCYSLPCLSNNKCNNKSILFFQNTLQFYFHHMLKDLLFLHHVFITLANAHFSVDFFSLKIQSTVESTIFIPKITSAEAWHNTKHRPGLVRICLFSLWTILYFTLLRNIIILKLASFHFI